ncbi:hypothetical protein [Phytohabitans houttuyneae]|uniref:hypothetical protein n=1 Tax=Phytohabitans houttuyneae TaxID=1076126 RepID=UPI0031F0471A
MRVGVVYGIYVLHPVTGNIVLGYVGKTRQSLRVREGQHRDEQPWADTIVGSAFVIAKGVWTEAQLDACEQHHIRSLRPLYNIDHNGGNPNRIPPWEAVAQRQAREPGWTPHQPPAVPYPRYAPYAGWTWRQWRRVLLAGLWLLLAGGLWWTAADVWHGWDGPRNAAVGASVPYGVAGAARLRRWWRRLGRRPRRRR